MFCVDAHHHLWQFNSAEYNWLEGDLAVLRRNFLAAELVTEAKKAGVSGTVAVQARQSVAEPDWLLQLAAETPLMLGVVGWLPLRDQNFPAMIERYRTQELLKGLRHIVQAEACGFLDDVAFNAGVDALQASGLVYDLLIYERQLEEATRFVDRHPDQTFVLNHVAKPRIAAGELQPWASRIRDLARRENVVCKVSGMATEAGPKSWCPDQLKPYFETVLECFTPARLMAGTDWPVLCAGCTYQRWWAMLSEWLADLSAEEQADILGRTAVKTYRLQVPASTRSQFTEISA